MFVAVSRFNSLKNIGRTKKAKRCSVKIPQPQRFKTRKNCYGSKPRCVTIMFVKIDLTLLLPEWMLESLKVVLTFESVDKILWCDHSNESYWAVLSCGTVQGGSNFWVCGENPMMWPFKLNLSACTFKRCYLFSKFYKTKFWKFCWILPLATFGCERVKEGTRKTAREKGSVWLSKLVENAIDDSNFVIISAFESIPSILSNVRSNTSLTASVCSPASLIPESFPLSPGWVAPSAASS